MLTLAEIESTMQIEFELRLEVLDEHELRQLLADPAALRHMAPPHLSAAEARSIAEATLADLLARKAAQAEARAVPDAVSPWVRLFTSFWAPLR